MRRPALAVVFCVGSGVGALLLWWMWITQPTWQYEFVWDGVHRPLAVIVVLLGACALAAWLVSPNRRHLAAIGAAALGVASAVAVIPALTYSYPPQRWRV